MFVLWTTCWFSSFVHCPPVVLLKHVVSFNCRFQINMKFVTSVCCLKELKLKLVSVGEKVHQPVLCSSWSGCGGVVQTSFFPAALSSSSWRMLRRSQARLDQNPFSEFWSPPIWSCFEKPPKGGTQDASWSWSTSGSSSDATSLRVSELLSLSVQLSTTEEDDEIVLSASCRDPSRPRSG